MLADAAAAVEELNLQSSALTDDEITAVVAATGLRRLRLDNNELTDAAVESLAALGSLQYLNLYGNAGITDASVETLAAMANLAKLYVWQTAITEPGIERLRGLRPDLDVQGGAPEGFTADVTEAGAYREQQANSQ